ncbi:uncharacterized protein [Panulirus ornatus]|uniref:uncharacterized protein n=1 Tax=Panulirus ornatus TaxID=150431 RepID=UPI003A85D73A
MYSSVNHIEEIPRTDYMVPEIRLKIIHLNLNERGESLTPPPRAAGEGCVLQRYARQPVVRKRLHKLESYDHLLHQLRRGWPAGCDKRLLVNPPGGVMPLQHCHESDPYAKDSPSPVKHEERGIDDDYGVFRHFVKGIHKLSDDGESLSSTIVRLLNRHTLAVAKKEQLLFETETLSNKSTLNDIIFQSALMAMNELLDDGALDITRRDMLTHQESEKEEKVDNSG